MSSDGNIKFGGMKFEQKVSTRKINKFVDELPEEKKQSMFQVVNELADAGMIKLLNQVTTIDDEMVEWQETNTGDE
jgi:hypothetical protein